MEKRTAYISYAKEDIAYAKWLSHVFEANGLSCYVSDHGIGGMESLTAQIEASSVFVLLYSKNIKNIDCCSKETEHAFNSGKQIFPVIVGKCEFLGQYSYYLSRFDRFELYKSRSKNIRLLIGQIKNAVKAEESGANEYRIAKYDVSLLTEEDIDRIIAGKKSHSRLSAAMSPFSRLYSNNPTVRYALKCFGIILAIFFLLLTFNGCAEVSIALFDLTMGEGFDAYSDLLLIAICGISFYGLWNLSYFPAVYIARLKIKKRFAIVLAAVFTVCMLLAAINIIGDFFR